jgi:hypothetical protein
MYTHCNRWVELYSLTAGGPGPEGGRAIGGYEADGGGVEGGGGGGDRGCRQPVHQVVQPGAPAHDKRVEQLYTVKKSTSCRQPVHQVVKPGSPAHYQRVEQLHC